MGIGQSPLIPLFRLQPDPEARFQRFGVNDSQLIGKPLLSLPAARKPAEPERTPEPPDPKREFEREAKPATSPDIKPDYTRPRENSLGFESPASLGTKLDMKA